MRVPRPLPRPSTGPALAQALLLAVLPHGGQLSARRNAWAGMVDDAQRARARREAETALDLARVRASSAGPHTAQG
jgi:hypothetical protein